MIFFFTAWRYAAMRKRGASWHQSFVTLIYCIQMAIRYLEIFYLRGSLIIIVFEPKCYTIPRGTPWWRCFNVGSEKFTIFRQYLTLKRYRMGPWLTEVPEGGGGGVFLGGQPLLTRSAETQRSSILRFTPTYAYSL